MKKILLIFIFILAFVLRFYQLGANPPSLDWDEASLGYNAYSILKTAKDEYGSFLPLSIRSFGDYKPPLYTYLTTISVAIFGLNEFSTRFISAFLGSLTVLIAYFLVKELFPTKNDKKDSKILMYLLFSLFFAVSPWHIQFSRVAFEANIALFFFISAILLFLKGVKKGIFLPISLVFFAISCYAYHSPRLIVPILVFVFLFLFYKKLKNKLFWLIFSFVCFIAITFPIIKQFKDSTSARFGSVSVINPDEKLGDSIKAIEMDEARGDIFGKLIHNRRFVFAREILAGYLDHFNIDFLFIIGDAPGRHHAKEMGMLYLIEFPFIIMGILYLLRNKSSSAGVILSWFMVAPVASSLTTGTPHAVRAIFYLPTFQIFTSFGFLETLRYISRKTIAKKTIKTFSLLFLLLLFTFNFYYYLNMYYVHTPPEYSDWWQYGYKELVSEVAKIEKSYDKIIVTYKYDQPYIYFLFYTLVDPKFYQQNWGGGEIKRANRSFGKYEFRNIDWKNDLKEKTLLVSTPDEIPDYAGKILKKIHFLDGSDAFWIVEK